MPRVLLASVLPWSVDRPVFSNLLCSTAQVFLDQGICFLLRHLVAKLSLLQISYAKLNAIPTPHLYFFFKSYAIFVPASKPGQLLTIVMNLFRRTVSNLEVVILRTLNIN